MVKDKKYNYIALCLCAIACIAWSYVVDLKYYRLMYFGWDLPLYANVMWNLCHGSIGTSLFGRNFMIDHFDAIAFLLVPVYFFFQSALTILYFKLFAFFTGAYVFYLLTSKRLGGAWGIAFMLAYISYPANVTMFFFEFNFENLSLPIIFLLFYFFEEKKYAAFMVSCFLLTMVKENMPLVVLMFGVYGFIMRREDWLRWGLYPLCLGLVTFIGEVFVLIPWFRQGFQSSNVYWYLYKDLGSSPGEIFKTIIFNEPKVFKLLFNSHNAYFLSTLFGPLLIAALLSPQILLIASPLFLENLLSNFTGQQSIYFFYSSTLAVFIFMAVIEILGRINIVFIRTFILGIMLFLLFKFNLEYFPEWQKKMPPIEEKQAVAQYYLSKIPSDAKIAASFKFLSPLSQRKYLYILLYKQNLFSHQAENIPDTVNYMAIDFAGRLDNISSIKQLLSQGQWKVQGAVDEMVFLRKRIYGETLISSAKSPFSWTRPRPKFVMTDNSLQLEDLDMPRSLKFNQRIMRIVFYWKVLKNSSDSKLPQVSLSIFQGRKRLYLKNRIVFYGLPMEKGEHDREVFYYFIPKLDMGRYRVTVSSLPCQGEKDFQAGEYNQNISVLSP